MHSCAPFMHLCAMPFRYTRYTPSPNDPCATHMHPYVTHPCALPMHPRAHFLHPCVMHPCAFFMHPCATHHLCSLYIHPLTQLSQTTLHPYQNTPSHRTGSISGLLCIHFPRSIQTSIRPIKNYIPQIKTPPTRLGGINLA